MSLIGIMGPQSTRRVAVKYHGLVNQGATCYLNSVLQVLFMTQDFRETVQSYYLNNVGIEHIDRELSDLFHSLKTSNTRTREITDKLRINNVYVQRDAAEHYEKILRLTSPNASQVFHGELVNRNICQKCCRVTENAAGFWHLPLPLVNNNNEYSVEKGIKDFFRPSMITGDDKMYCENCDEKCDAVLDCYVKHYPEVLVLLLKRFEMIYVEDSVRKVKINCPVKMSDTLHMKKNHTYKLYAFVEHFGDLQSGHYNAKIKSLDEERWYIFDDLHVEESGYQHFQLDPTETSENVYLLFYRQQKGDSSHIVKTQHDTWTSETQTATVTSGTKDTLRSTEEDGEEENDTTETTKVTSAFNKGSGVKDKLVRPAMKSNTISNFRREIKRTEKEGRSTQNYNSKKAEGRQPRGEAPFRQSAEEKPLLHTTPQQCLERVEQKHTSSQRSSRDSLQRPKSRQDAANDRSKGKKSTHCSSKNVKQSNTNHTHGSKSSEAGIEIYSSDEEIGTTQEKMEDQTLNIPRGEMVLETNDRKTKKSWWRNLLCIPRGYKKKYSK